MTEFEKSLCESMGNLTVEDLEDLLNTEQTDLDRGTLKNIRKKTYKKLGRRMPIQAAGAWIAAAACLVLVVLFWQKDTVYAQLQKLFGFLPGVGIVTQEEEESFEGTWYYTIQMKEAEKMLNGWNVVIEKGYISRQRASGSNEGKGDFVLKFTADKREGYEELLPAFDQMEIYCDGERLSNGKSYFAKWRHLEEASRGNGIIQMHGVQMDEFSTGKTYELRLKDQTVFSFSLEELLAVNLTGSASGTYDNTLLAVEKERTDEGLKVLYYPYYEDPEMVLLIPSPLRFTKTEDSYFYYNMGKQVVPYLTDGIKEYPAISAAMEEQDYTDIAQTVFDAPEGKEYTLHVPYMVAQEQRYDTDSSQWVSGLEQKFNEEANVMCIPKMEIGESKKLDYEKDFSKATVRFSSVTRISAKEMKNLSGISYEDDVHGYYLKLDVDTWDGWELLWLNFAVDGEYYGYYYVPHLDNGKLKGFMLVTGEQIWENIEADELKLAVGNPGYLLETGFVIDGIVE